jgi:hypothetical protein
MASFRTRPRFCLHLYRAEVGRMSRFARPHYSDFAITFLHQLQTSNDQPRSSGGENWNGTEWDRWEKKYSSRGKNQERGARKVFFFFNNKKIKKSKPFFLLLLKRIDLVLKSNVEIVGPPGSCLRFY